MVLSSRAQAYLPSKPQEIWQEVRHCSCRSLRISRERGQGALAGQDAGYTGSLGCGR